jgi:catechol 2,3-dioxygenase-like lactoylglutathione lyase family enzyme
MQQQLAHVALLVRDYEEALAFYTGKLGFRLVADTSLGCYWPRLRGPPNLARSVSRRAAGYFCF